ncbi:hypothetical protein [Avibacterium paragallinarum]|uniref:Uncharacterized protein n=3 Tax=Avibacterium paragallinarum TaxID=728 RepID=A0A380X1M8_AVIPA|nr:hypothetical protein [Avibacterium paragallinarum]KAA6207854.1 hypothetical protein F1968_12520 [Avibacterium paragallinarum]POY46442.1 hypothetical protein C3364_07435 [Avibacterium paragallinarum]RZN53577.1 hypothetical protein EIG79_12360 [Avibacterium paragallinarum]RZN53974.1 hypothetical protein EIG79_12320 [Avibacterium paragallinarum]RZN69700.1 hypothetical protein EIG77_09630 [Avibacterium paragallinarum]
MITYQDLCKQHQQFNHILIERRAILREQIRQLRLALAMDLGLTEKYYKKQLNDPSPTEPYVRVTDSDGAPTESHQLKAEYDELHNPSITFGLSLALEESAITYPKKPVRLVITAYYLSENTIRFVFPNIDDTPAFGINIDDDKQSKFSVVIEAYKQLVMKTFTI